MSIRFRRATAVVAASLLTACISFAPSAGASVRATTFTDPTGDAGTAADVSTVVVSNDASGLITFQVNIANQFANTNTVDIYVDADRNSSTGDPQGGGVEYDLYADFGTGKWDLGYWNGSAWVEAPSSSTVRVSYTTNQLTFSINRSELGNTSGFNFWVDSCDADCSAGHEDQAPNIGAWPYQLETAAPGGGTAPVHLSVLFLLAPKTAKAGQDYMVGMAVQRSDTDGFLGSEGTVQCRAVLGGRPLASSGGQIVTITYKGARVSAAVCDWRLPKSAHGKSISGTITESYAGAKVVRAFSARVS